MSQAGGAFSTDLFEKSLINPRVEKASLTLANTHFATLLSTECQSRILAEFASELRGYSCDVVETLIRENLAKRSPFWGLDVRLAPRAQAEEARQEVAAAFEEAGEAMLNETAPLLLKVLDRQVERFASALSETCNRIWEDRHEIAATLLAGGIDGEIGLVVDMDASLADCHDGGRHTCIVTSQAGRFVYKPHDCQVDRWFANVSETFMPDALRQPRVILRSDATGAWGFEEFIELQPVESEAGLARYWHNMGRAFALFQALGSEDLHSENFVACGERPALIDMETVITSDPAHIGNPETSPNLGFASKGFGRDLGMTLIKSSLLPSPAGEADNTSPLLAHGRTCLPRWQGEEHDVLGYEANLLAGLDEGLAELASCTEELACAVEAASDIPIRRLIRDKSVYGRLLARLRKTDAYDPQKRSELLAPLHRPLVRGLSETISPLATSEIACLLDGDIPYFYAVASSHTITGSDGTADNRLLNASAMELALSHIAALDEPHRAFVHAVTEANISRAILPSGVGEPTCHNSEEPLSSSDALLEAERVFRLLEEQTIRSPSGEKSWLFRARGAGVLSESNVFLSNGLGGRSRISRSARASNRGPTGMQQGTLASRWVPLPPGRGNRMPRSSSHHPRALGLTWPYRWHGRAGKVTELCGAGARSRSTLRNGERPR